VPFETMDLGRVLQTAEAIKGMRNDSITQKLQQKYMGMRNEALTQDMDRQARAEQAVLGKEKAQQLVAKTGFILQATSPKNYVEQNEPELIKQLEAQGLDWASTDDEDVRQLAKGFQDRANAELGQGPAAPQTTKLGAGDIIVGADGKTIASNPKSNELTPYQSERLGLDRQRFAEQQSAEERRAREQRGFTAEQNRLNREAQSDLVQDKANVKQRGVEQQNQRAYSVYQAGISGLTKGLGGSVTGPIAGRMPAFTAKQQIAQGSVAAMAPVLKQLFRSSGEGTFTDRDQDLLLEMVPSRTDEPEAIDAKLKNIDNIVRAKLGIPPAEQPQSPSTQALPVGQSASVGGFTIKRIK
jgi:hypothetical protein